MSQDGRTIFHRVVEIDIKGLAIRSPSSLAEFRHLSKISLTSVMEVEPNDIHQAMFADWDVKTRRPDVDVTVMSKRHN